MGNHHQQAAPLIAPLCLISNNNLCFKITVVLLIFEFKNHLNADMIRNLTSLTILVLLVFKSVTLDAQHKTSFNVATFNLRFDTPNDGENAWPNRKEFVKNLIAYHEFDIMGTQELLHSQIKDLLEMDGWAYTGAGRDDGLTGGEHSAIFYNKERFKLLTSGDFWFSETPEIPSKGWDATCCNRICSWAKFRDTKSRKEFYVFNAHFDHQGIEARRQSGRLIIEKIKEIAKGLPVIFCSDLNSPPDTEQVQHISSFLNDSYLVSKTKPYGPVGTFSGFKMNAPLDERIDYVFVSKEFKVQKYGALTDFLNYRFPSDHLPVVVRVSF